MSTYCGVNDSKCLKSVLKAVVGAFSVIEKTDRETEGSSAALVL